MNGEFGNQSTYPSADSIETIMNELQSEVSGCTDSNLRDTYVGNVADCGTLTEITDNTATSGKTCMTWNSVQTSVVTAARYASGCPDVATKFANLKAALNDYKDKLMDVSTAPSSTASPTALQKTITDGFNDYVYADINTFKTNLKDAADKLSGYDSDISSTMNFMKSLSGDLYGSMNCTIFRRELKIVQNIVCFEFTLNYARVSYVMGLTGPFMFFFSMCLCCSIRCGIKHKKNNPNEGKKPKPNQVQDANEALKGKSSQPHQPLQPPQQPESGEAITIGKAPSSIQLPPI